MKTEPTGEDNRDEEEALARIERRTIPSHCAISEKPASNSGPDSIPSDPCFIGVLSAG